MSAPIFVFEGLRNATITASAGSATGYPTTHLQDDRYDSLWKAGSNTQNQTLMGQFAAAKNLDCMHIANHNLANLGLTSLDIETSTNGTDWTQALSLTSFPDPLYSALTSISRAYARLKFVKSSALSAAPQIGLVYIGARADMPLYSNSPERGLQGDAIVAESMSGLRYASTLHADRESWKIDFGRCTVANLLNWARLVRGVNGMHSILFGSAIWIIIGILCVLKRTTYHTLPKGM